MQAHATPEQLAEFLPAGTNVSDADRLLLRASAHIDYYTHTPYSIDRSTGLAANERVAAALRDATCAQVEHWLETGEHNAIDGLSSTQVSAGGHSGFRPPPLAPRAHQFLALAGLTRPGIGDPLDEFT